MVEILADFAGCKQPPDEGDKRRQLCGKVGIPLRCRHEGEQLLADQIVQGVFQAEACFLTVLTFLNFNLNPGDLSLELCFDADFVDVFQVRGARRKVHGQYYRPVRRDHRLAFFYRGLDGILRRTLIEVTVTPLRDGGGSRADTRDFPASLRERRHPFAKWQRHSTQFHTNHDIFDAALNTAPQFNHSRGFSSGLRRSASELVLHVFLPAAVRFTCVSSRCCLE